MAGCQNLLQEKIKYKKFKKIEIIGVIVILIATGIILLGNLKLGGVDYCGGVTTWDNDLGSYVQNYWRGTLVKFGFIYVCDNGKSIKQGNYQGAERVCAYCDKADCGYYDGTSAIHFDEGIVPQKLQQPYLGGGDSIMPQTYYVKETFTVQKSDGSIVELKTVKEATREVLGGGSNLESNLREKYGITSWFEGIFYSADDVVCSENRLYGCDPLKTEMVRDGAVKEYYKTSTLSTADAQRGYWVDTGDVCGIPTPTTTIPLPPTTTTTTIPSGGGAGNILPLIILAVIIIGAGYYLMRNKKR